MQVVNNAEAEPAVVRQRVGSVTYTAQAALQELQRQAFKKAKWSQYFYPAFMPNEPDGPVYLICKACNLNLSAANPSDTLKHTQNGRCKGPPAATTTTLNHASSGPSVASSSGQTGIRDFQPSAGQIKAAKDELAMYFYTSETPFGRVENVHLRKAFSLLGVSLMGATTLRTTMLADARAKVQVTVEAKMVRSLVAHAPSTACTIQM